MSRQPQRLTLLNSVLPAPIRGVNAVSPASAMHPQDCIYAWNVIAAELGLESRPGFSEWATGLTGEGDDNAVRAILSFSGNAPSGTGDRVFGTTSTGIWDVSTSTDAPTPALAFDTTGGNAGYGVGCVASTLAGRFLLYCDETNGYHRYSETLAEWLKVPSGTTQLWEPSTDYFIEDRVVYSGRAYVCSADGTSSSSTGPVAETPGVVDGTVTWDYESPAVAGAVGPSLADQRAGFTLATEDLVFVVVWKSRVWLVQRNSSRAWYLDVNAISGTATSFDFGSQMRAGGPLVGLWNWSYDGGNGMETLLVGISGAGDVVIYQGTDPTSASTFGIKGVWYVGGLPAGRNIATDTGGDLLVLSLLGVIPLSKLVLSGGEERDASQYATASVGPLFVRLAAQFGSQRGWAIVVHPTANALMVNVPAADGKFIQLCMSYATKGWFPWRGLPVQSAATWNKELYFGTPDGRVCRNVGYVDAVLLDDDESYTPVEFSFLTSFQTLDSANQKQVQLLRPAILSDTPGQIIGAGAGYPFIQCTARYDYDINEPNAPSLPSLGGAYVWDTAAWDAVVWSGEYGVSQPWSGATGIGRAVAIAVQGSAVARTTFVEVDVHFAVGGVL